MKFALFDFFQELGVEVGLSEFQVFEDSVFQAIFKQV